jgi:predicted N-acyltransferase
VQRFEGGAQGEHKMARALMPVMTHSAHGVADTRFAQAIGQFLEREGRGVDNYMEHLGQRTPYKPASDLAAME